MRVEFPKNDPKVACFVRLFPGYRGRKTVKVSSTTTYNVSDYWSGGSRNYCVLLDLNTYTALTYEQAGFKRQEQSNPFNQAMGDLVLRPGLAVVEECVFCGKSLGIRVYLHESDFSRIVGGQQ